MSNLTSAGSLSVSQTITAGSNITTGGLVTSSASTGTNQFATNIATSKNMICNGFTNTGVSNLKGLTVTSPIFSTISISIDGVNISGTNGLNLGTTTTGKNNLLTLGDAGSTLNSDLTLNNNIIANSKTITPTELSNTIPTMTTISSNVSCLTNIGSFKITASGVTFTLPNSNYYSRIHIHTHHNCTVSTGATGLNSIIAPTFFKPTTLDATNESYSSSGFHFNMAANSSATFVLAVDKWVVEGYDFFKSVGIGGATADSTYTLSTTSLRCSGNIVAGTTNSNLLTVHSDIRVNSKTVTPTQLSMLHDILTTSTIQAQLNALNARRYTSNSAGAYVGCDVNFLCIAPILCSIPNIPRAYLGNIINRDSYYIVLVGYILELYPYTNYGNTGSTMYRIDNSTGTAPIYFRTDDTNFKNDTTRNVNGAFFNNPTNATFNRGQSCKLYYGSLNTEITNSSTYPFQTG